MLYKIKPLEWEKHVFEQHIAYEARIPGMAVYTIESGNGTWQIYYNDWTRRTIGIKDTIEDAQNYAAEHWRKHLENAIRRES